MKPEEKLKITQQWVFQISLLSRKPKIQSDSLCDMMLQNI